MSETEILSVPLDAEMKREADKIFGEKYSASRSTRK